MGELGDKFFFVCFGFRLRNSCLFQFRAHDIKAFRKRAEKISLIHFQRNIQIAACDSLRKALQFAERPDHSAVQIEKIPDRDAALHAQGSREKEDGFLLLGLQDLCIIIVNDDFSGYGTVGLDIQDGVPVGDSRKEALAYSGPGSDENLLFQVQHDKLQVCGIRVSAGISGIRIVLRLTGFGF